MENKETLTKEMEQKFWKIGEVVVIEDETKPEDANGSLALSFSDGLTEHLNKEGNEDLKGRMEQIVTLMHEVLVELQERYKDGE